MGARVGPQKQRLENLFARGTLGALNRGKKMQRVQAKLTAGESKQSLEFFENYGFTSAPGEGAEVLCAFIDGDRSHGIVIAVADRRYRIGLEAGEAAIYDDLGRVVHLTRQGIVVDGKDDPVRVLSTSKVRFETPLLECTGNIKDNCDALGTTMLQMRTTYNIHFHDPLTTPPTQQMGGE